MKRNTTRFLLVLLMMLSLCFLCTACGGGAGSVESAESAGSAESSTISPQDDPNEGLGDDFNDSLTEDDEPDRNDSGNGDDDYDLDSEVYHRDISEFQGTWYYDNDLAAEMFIVIDGYGNWSYYQRVPGDPEATEMDHGTFSYSTDEFATYYADSTMYDGLRFRMYDQDEGVLVWDGDTYYRME